MSDGRMCGCADVRVCKCADVQMWDVQMWDVRMCRCGICSMDCLLGPAGDWLFRGETEMGVFIRGLIFLA